MSVDRCICHNITFRELRDIARAEQLDLAALSARTGCATGCTMCRPYIELMLATGRTEFAVLTDASAKGDSGGTRIQGGLPGSDARGE